MEKWLCCGHDIIELCERAGCKPPGRCFFCGEPKETAPLSPQPEDWLAFELAELWFGKVYERCGDSDSRTSPLDRHGRKYLNVEAWRAVASRIDVEAWREVARLAIALGATFRGDVEMITSRQKLIFPMSPEEALALERSQLAQVRRELEVEVRQSPKRPAK